MRLRFIYIFCFLLLTVSLCAERVTLRSGKQFTGTVLSQSNGVLLFQTKSGQRFQFPMDDIQSIETDVAEEAKDADTKAENALRPVAFRLAVSGGLAAVSGENCGGMTTAELQIGTRQIAGKNIFLGGSVGYAGAFLKPVAHFIPLQAVVALPVPFTSSRKVCTEVGTSFGYAFATKGQKGGITGSLSAGARFAISEQNAVFVGGVAQFIQTERDRTTSIGTETYTHSAGTTIWLIGAKIALQF